MYVYIFVRKDIYPAYRAVQCSHAAILAAHQFDLGSLGDHPYLVVCGAKDDKDLERISGYLSRRDVRHVRFNENDMDDQLTAIATEPIPGDCPKRAIVFKRFQCLKE